MKMKKYRDVALGGITLVVSVLYLFYTQQIKTRPKLTPEYANARIIPWLLGIALAVLSVFLIAKGIRDVKKTDSEESGEKIEKTDLAAVVLTFVVIIAYITLMQPLGFCLSTALYLFFQMLVLAPVEKRKPLLFAGISVGFTVLTFVAFRIGLQQLLPRGMIESLMGF